MKKLANPTDEKSKITDRARSYLHTNCAHCHRFGGGGAVNFELTLDSDFKALSDVAPKRGDFAIPEAKLISQGQPYRSTLYYRMAKFGKDRMPHIGAEWPDSSGLWVIREWIRDMKQVVPENTPGVLADFLANPEHAIGFAEFGHLDKSLLDEAKKLPPGPVRDLFSGYFPPDGKPRTLGSNPRPRAILALTGDAVRGKEVFLAEKQQCMKCHKYQDKGIDIGPDLTKIGKDRSPTDLTESLLEPSRRVEAKYQAYTVKTLDGRSFTGLITKRDEKELVLREANNMEMRLKADNIEEVRASRQSLMPDGLLADLTPQQAADLLAFLRGSQ